METIRILRQVDKLIALATNNPAAEEARSAAVMACTLIVSNGFRITNGVPSETTTSTIDDEPVVPEWPSDVKPSGDSWEAAIDQIDDMLDQRRYKWAKDTLEGIAATIQSKQRISENQWRAIRNIRAAGDRR